MLALKGCTSESDLRTLEDWATCACVSYSSLRESCRLLGMRPHDARNLVRVLRAVIKSRQHQCPPAAMLDVSDSRTLEQLMARAGVDVGAAAGSVSIDQVLRSQRFIAFDNEGLRVLRPLLHATASSYEQALPATYVKSAAGGRRV